MVLVHGEHDGFADVASRVALRFFQKRLAHDAIAGGRENFPFKVFDFEIFLLLVDDDRPAGFIQRLRGDVGTEINDFWQAQKRAFRVFHRVNDVVTERGKARFAAEIIVGVAEQTDFKGFRIFLFKLLDVDVFQIRPRRGGQADARGLEKLNDFAGIAVNRAVRLVVHDEIKMERREFLAVTAVHHERLQRGHHDRRAKQFAWPAAGGFVEDGLVFREHDVEIFKRLLGEFNAVNDEKHALGIARWQKTADERGAQERLACAGRHFQKKFAHGLFVKQPRNGVHRVNLITADSQVRAEFFEIVGRDDFAAKRTRRLKIFQTEPFQVFA